MKTTVIAPPLFIWLQSIFILSQSVGNDSTHEGYGRIGLKTLKSIQEISLRVQQTHPIGFRSACTSLLFQILVGPLVNPSEVFSNPESLINLISKLRLQELLERSSTKNIINILKERVQIKSFEANLEKDARYNAVGFFLANEFPNMRMIRGHFDTNASAEIESWIKILTEYNILSPIGPYIDEAFGISFFEFIFRTFDEKTILIHYQTAEILGNLAENILGSLPKNLIQITLSKIISCARTFCATGNPDKIAYALCLLNVGITSDHHSNENFSQIEKMAKDFHWGGKFETRPKTEVHFYIMKWAWKLLHHVTKFQIHGDDQLISVAEDALPKMNPSGQFFVFETVLAILEKSSDTLLENFAIFLLAAWQSVLVAMHSDKFSSMYQMFVHMVIHRTTISQIPSVVEDFGEKIFEKSKTKTGLILPLAQRLLQIQLGNTGKNAGRNIGLSPFKQTPNLIYKILFYNDAHRKDLEIYKTIQDRILKLGDFVDFIEERTEVEDETSLVRIVAIQMMLNFSETNQSETDQSELVSNERIEFIRQMLDINQNESRKKTKYYIDSSTHRNKERCFQYILLMLLNDQFYLKMTLSQSRDLCKDLISSLINDEQASISALQQLCIALVLKFAFDQGLDFWSEYCLPHIDRFGDTENTGRSVSVSGLLISGFLFAQTQPEDNGSEFLLEIIPKLIRLQQSNNYVVRIYAIGILQSVYNWFQNRPGKKSLLAEKFPFLEDHVGYSMKVTTGNVGKNVTRVISNNFLKEFQVKNCALVTIFNTIPRIFGSKSWLQLDHLGELESISKIQFINPDTDIFEHTQTDNDEIESEVDDENVGDNGQFCQQKVTPWMMDESDENLKDDQGLIVCCSLIDKPNNLGGITRTAEVFGATELIFDNLKVLNDKNYTSLAVTGNN